MRRKLLLTLFLLLASFGLVKAQNYYRSPGTGVTVDLGSAANWQVSTDNVSWSAATVAPMGSTALPSGSTITMQDPDHWQNNTVTTGNVTIPAGVTLTVNSNAALGTFSTTAGGTIAFSTGSTLVFAGTTAQYLPPASGLGNSVYNLTINNPTSVSVNTVTSGSTYLNLNGVLNLMAGTFNCSGTGGYSFFCKGSVSANGGVINTGSFTLNGTTAQSITGTEFSSGQIYNLTINSGTGGSASTTGALKVTNQLNLTNGTFTLGGALTITAPTMTVAGSGVINTQNNMVLVSGTVAQAIPASFFSSNTVNNLTIGNSTTGVTSAGPLTIGTSYTVTSLKSGVTPLIVTGTATIGGTLTINAFATAPTVGQTYTILSGTAVSGNFSGVILPNGYAGTVANNGTTLTLTITSITAPAYYHSPGTGVTVDLGSATNWQFSSDGNTWGTAIVAPTAATAFPGGGTITIQNPDIWQNNTVATTIPAGVTLTLNSNAALGVFSSTAGHLLTCSPASGSLSASTLIFAGTAPQKLPSGAYIQGSNIYNLTINNSQGVSTSSSSLLNIKGVLNLQSGQFNSTLGSIYLYGSITGTGTINSTQTFSMSGTAAQTLQAVNFLNQTLGKLTINNTLGVTTTGNFTISSYFNLIAGTLTLGGALNIGASGANLLYTAGGISAGGNTVTFSSTTAQQAVPAAGFFTLNGINNLAITNTYGGVTYPTSLTIGTSLTAQLATGVTSLAVTGTATIGGALTISGFNTTPTVGQVYTIVSGSTAVSGTFSSVALPAGFTGTVAYTPTSVTLTVTSLPSDATLLAMSLSNGTLSPVFSPNTTSYTAGVANNVASITLTPTANQANATITVNTNATTSGHASVSLPLNVGANPITTVVTAADGTTQKTYTTTVTRWSNDATLSAMSISGGTLSPVFAPGTTSYTASVNISTITLTPTVNQANATVTVNGTPVASGTASGSLQLNLGPNTITTVVTAQDGTTTQTYTINVTRLSNDATLSAMSFSSGTLQPAFASGTYNGYTVNVANNVSTITLTPTVNQANATVTVNGTPVASGTASGSLSLNVGNNTITTVVTAQDGTTTGTYTVTVIRAQSSNANLSNLSVSSSTLTPTFSGSVINYAVGVPNATGSISITPTVADGTATLKVNSITATSGSAVPITLAGTITAITVTVTAQDGTIQTYTVTVTKSSLSNNANLSSLSLSNGTLLPSFASGTTSYTANVANNVSSISLTPTVADANAAVKVNGTTVASGTASGTYNLNVGNSNTFTVSVTAQDNITVQNYAVTVGRAASSNANLSALTLSGGTLSPAFAPGTTNYSAGVGSGVSSITITPTLADGTATVKVNGTPVANGAAVPVSLNAGANTITTVVTAQDGTTTQTYITTVSRLSSDATLSAMSLSSGTLSPVFASGTSSYTASVANSVSTVTLTPKVNQANATVTVNGKAVASGSASAGLPLNVGNNTITTVVTAQDGTTTKTYTIIVNRISNDATLSAMSFSSGTLQPAFAPGTYNGYTVNVANNVSSITLTPTVNQANATVTVNGKAVASAAASGSLALNVGNNTITTIVTAQDGTTKATYTVIVSRAMSSVATLSKLSLSSGTLAPGFASGTTNYTASVGELIASITVTPTVTDPTAIVKVNGNTVTSGSPSASIALNVGVNTITTVVTAQDGTTTKTYTTTITRASSVATLSSLTISNGNLTPDFASAITSYTTSVANDASTTTITPTVTQPNATVTVNGSPVVSGQPSQMISLFQGDNTVTVVVTAQDGITKVTYTLLVRRVPPEVEVTATNILSPNGDGKNDTWQIKDINLYPNNTVSIYDRAGRMIYSKHGYQNDWDGTLKGAQLEQGTYFYTINLGNGGNLIKGFITIIRE